MSQMRPRCDWCACLIIGLTLLSANVEAATAATPADGSGRFEAGAAAVDVTPEKLPALVNGYFTGRSIGQIESPLYARALVLSDGSTKLAIVVVDNLMMPRELLDEAKRRAADVTGIHPKRMLIAATHTHQAPSVMGCLGSECDDDYRRWLPKKIAESIVAAAGRLRPARAGWTAVDDFAHTHCRRWLLAPEHKATDPFGRAIDRARMHPGYQNPATTGPSGPVDPALTLLAIQSADGKPLALLANYSMHYFRSKGISADYCGRFVKYFADAIGGDDGNAEPGPVVMMSQGTSGDLHWMDYSQPPKRIDIDAYARGLVEVALAAYRQISYHDAVSLAVAERRLKLRRRAPDSERLAWARKILAEMGDGPPTNDKAWIYAREQIFLHEEPERELILQAIRVGGLGMAAIPNEVYGLTGLKLKAQSPLEPTMNIELAGGAEGYIPPPEQHALGGYSTWEARTAALEEEAEPKIVAALVELLEEVSGKTRRPFREPSGPYAQAVLASRPLAYWRLGEWEMPVAHDATAANRGAQFEPGLALYLPGPAGRGFCAPDAINRSVHLAGGRLKAELPPIGRDYSIELWFDNRLPVGYREVTGYLFSRGSGADGRADRDYLGIGGTTGSRGRLFVGHGNGNGSSTVLAGHTSLETGQWNCVVFVRCANRVEVYLNGDSEPEISGELRSAGASERGLWWFGGRSDGLASFEGKLDEVAVYDRALKREEIVAHWNAAAIDRPSDALPEKTTD